MITLTETYRRFLLDASVAAEARAGRARNPGNKQAARALAAIFAAAATGPATYDGTYRTPVPLDSLVSLAEVVLGEDAPQIERSA